VRSLRKLVFQRTTAPVTLHSDQLYYVLWRPAGKLRGPYRYCVHTVSARGTASPDSCATITLS
jgi:hypothetical protein